jgi:hypothetical protein
MKRTLVAFIVALFVATGAIAGTLTSVACTADHKSASLTLLTVDGTSKVIEDEIKAAFQKTATSLSADELVGPDGFDAFISKLSEEDFEAISELTGPPTIGGACKGA